MTFLQAQNKTIEKFGYPVTLIAEYEYWVVLMREAQVTLGSIVIAAKSDVTRVGDLDPLAGAEFIRIAADFEQTLSVLFGAKKFNYMALMMVDPHPHYHAFPRYSDPVSFLGERCPDEEWPKPPVLSSSLVFTDEQRYRLLSLLQQKWIKQQ